MERDELLFQLGYSARLERMTSTLLGRIDRGTSFAQLFLGASIFANGPNWLQYVIATLLCAITVFVIVYQPAVKQMLAAAQRDAYDCLLVKARDLPDAEISEQLVAIQKQDSAVLGALCNPAHLGECIRLDREPNVTLDRHERLVAWLAGDLPRLPNA
ncbi:hypothetical protein OKW41_005994 [Paraburkholderia sp. UCT70]|uniref:hypothetical protein n=1 Tax=Paraburkholderia sp. UCT70 TaxID=2991068 RepID=UPI003D20405C